MSETAAPCDLVLALRAGSSLQAQAAAMGFPSTQQASAVAGAPTTSAQTTHDVLIETISSVLGICVFTVILVGEPLPLALL